MLISRLIEDERPMAFTSLGAVFTLVGLALGLAVVLTLLESGLVQRPPTAVLTVGFIMLAPSMSSRASSSTSSPSRRMS